MRVFWRDVKTELEKRIPFKLVWGRERLAQETPYNVIFVDFVRAKQSPVAPSPFRSMTATKAFTNELPYAVEIVARSTRPGANADDHEQLALNVMAEFMIVVQAVAHAKHGTPVKSSTWGFVELADPGSAATDATIDMVVTLAGSLIETTSVPAGGLVAAITVAVVDKDGTELETACAPAA